MARMTSTSGQACPTADRRESSTTSSMPAMVTLPSSRSNSSPSVRGGSMSQLNQPMGGNEVPRFGGPATMMRLPTHDDAQGLDVAFIGVPMDIATSNRPGTRLGPRQIRDESRMLRPYNMATRAAPFDSLQVGDIGDVPINTFHLPKSVEIIARYYDEVLRHGC